MINKTKRVFIAEYANHVEPWTKSHDRYYYIIRHNELELSGRQTFPMIVNFVTAQSTLWLKKRLSLSLILSLDTEQLSKYLHPTSAITI